MAYSADCMLHAAQPCLQAQPRAFRGLVFLLVTLGYACWGVCRLSLGTRPPSLTGVKPYLTGASRPTSTWKPYTLNPSSDSQTRAGCRWARGRPA